METQPLHPLGINNEGSNCWANAVSQCIFNIPAYQIAMKSLPAGVENSPVVQTSLRVNAIVVTSYLLLGIGIALACSSLYLAFTFSPLIAFASPSLPIAFGALGIQQTTPNSLLLQGNRPLIEAMARYKEEQRHSADGSRSSINSQTLRLWAHAKGLITSKSVSSHEDPADLLRYFLDQSGHYLPPMVRQRTYYDGNGWIVHRTDPEQEANPLPIFDLKLGNEQQQQIPFTQLLEGAFSYEVDPNKAVSPQGVRSEITKHFTSPPGDITIRLDRAVYDQNGREMKNEAHVKGLAHFTGKADWFGQKSSYKTDGFIVHQGRSQSAGHYVSYLLIGDQWWEMNDHNGTRISHQKAQEEMEKAYLIHAVKESSAGLSFRGILSSLLGG